MHVAAIPSAIFAIEMIFTVGVILHPGSAFGLITVVFGGCGGLLIYVLVGRALRITEISQLMATVGGRFGGGSQPGTGTQPRPGTQGRGGPPRR